MRFWEAWAFSRVFGSRVRVTLSADDVLGAFGIDTKEAFSEPLSPKLMNAEAMILSRMARAVCEVMDFTRVDVQILFLADLRRVAQGVSPDYIGSATWFHTQIVKSGSSHPSLREITAAMQKLSSDTMQNNGVVNGLNALREFIATIKEAAPKGMWPDISSPMVTCLPHLGSCTAMTADWDAGQVIGVHTGNRGFMGMCEVLPSRDGGVSLLFDLTSMSCLHSIFGQSPPSDWVKRVRSPEFRQTLLNQSEQGKASGTVGKVHPIQTE